MNICSEMRALPCHRSALEYLLLLIVASLLGLMGCTNAVHSPVLLRPVDGSTSIASLSTYTDPRDGRVVKVFLVHGMTHSDPNWADVFIQQFAARLGVNVPNCTDPFLQPTVDAAAVYLPWVAPPARVNIPPATLCIVTNASSHSPVTYEFFALGWSPLTDKYKCLPALEGDREKGDPIKTYFPNLSPNGKNLCLDDQPYYPKRRAVINGSFIKDIVLDDGMPDVVLYFAPKVRPLFRNVVAQALCVMHAYTPPTNPPDPPFVDAPLRVDMCNSPQAAQIDDRFIFITHSLGSNILLDTLCELMSCVTPSLGPLATQPEDSRQMKFQMDTVILDFFVYPTPFYMLANQNTLLSLIKADPITDFGSSGRAGRIFDIRQHPFFLDLRARLPDRIRHLGIGARPATPPSLDIIAFSDPNDDLSFLMQPQPLPHSQESLADSPEQTIPVTVKNVLVTNHAELVWLFENPLPAHVNYYKAPKPSGLLDVIVCGMDNGSVNACAPAL